MITGDVEVHLAHARDGDPLRGLLDEDELRRIDALHRPEDQTLAVSSHALLRLALALRCGVDAADVVLERRCPTCGSSDHGRLEAPDLGVHLSLAHAGDLVAVALSDDGPVGVDVEQLAACGFEGFDEVALGPAEQRAVARLDPREQAEARAVTWVRKEALLKATGHGLTVEPATLELGAHDDLPRLVAWPAGPAPDVHLEDVPAPGQHVAAVALLDPTGRLAAIEVDVRDGDELLDLG